MSRPMTIKHPLLKQENNTSIIKDTVREHIQKTFGVETKVSILSENSLKVDFNNRLGSAKSGSRDRVRDSLINLLQEEFGIDPIITRDSSAYDITLFEQEEPDLPVTKKEVEDESNVILDSRFIWFFTVLDEFSEPLVEMINTLEEAIDAVVASKDAKYIIANPYVDPDPSKPEVDLIFADNPGPVVVYDGINSPSIIAPSEEDEEEIQEESTQADGVASQVTSYPQQRTRQRPKKSKKPKGIRLSEAVQEPQEITPEPKDYLKVQTGSDDVVAYNGLKQLIASYEGNPSNLSEEFKGVTIELVQRNLEENVRNITIQLLKKLQQRQVVEENPGRASLMNNLIDTGKVFNILASRVKTMLSANKDKANNEESLDSIASELGIK
ncbi:MAG: hypothetical protein M0Q87_14855 [Ottowia sp.]|nr:hypothetical protein [Ottowia sp.]